MGRLWELVTCPGRALDGGAALAAPGTAGHRLSKPAAVHNYCHKTATTLSVVPSNTVYGRVAEAQCCAQLLLAGMGAAYY